MQLPVLRNQIHPFKRTDLQTRWDEIFKSFDEIFNDAFFANDLSIAAKDRTGYPRCDVATYPEKYTVEATVPGLTKDDVKIELFDDTDGNRSLAIKSAKRTDKSEVKSNYVRKEIHSSSFCRTFTLPKDVVEEQITAEVKNGILTLEIPRWREKTIEEPKTRSIEVK